MKLQNLSLKINRKLILAQSDRMEHSARTANCISKSLRIKAEIFSNRNYSVSPKAKTIRVLASGNLAGCCFIVEKFPLVIK